MAMASQIQPISLTMSILSIELRYFIGISVFFLLFFRPNCNFGPLSITDLRFWSLTK